MMTSSRPYLVRALYEWIVDNGCTPYILVNALVDGVQVPQEHVKDGQIVLNISPSAVAQLHIGNDWLECNGRFGGVARQLLVPLSAVMGIYARENGQGMLFEHEPTPSGPADGGDGGAEQKRGKPSLKVIK
jgi:stringent starvation protein B